jgi:uncharacterized protein YjiS (DUF1127 family)
MRLAHWCPDASALVDDRPVCVYSHQQRDTGGKHAAKHWQALGKGIIMNVARSFNNWRKYRQTVSELGRMSNRALHDLGIDRGDIQRVARDAPPAKS